MLSEDDKLWLGLAAHLGFLSSDDITRVLGDTQAPDAQAPLAIRFVNRKLLSAEDLEALSALAARATRVHGTADSALAFVTTHTPSRTAPWLSMGDTVKSGEHPRPIDSLDGLDFVVPELDGRYRFEKSTELGRGGLGRVVSTRDQVMGREVAMKQLLPERSPAAAKDTVQSVTVEARFLREARLAAQLEHPGIVPVYEVGRRADGSLYYTMRRIRGRTLAEAVRGAKTMPERLRLVANVLAVAQALAYTHSRSVIHRDVKPQNVMLGSFGETYLLDWGLARVKGKADARAQELSMAPDITGGLKPGAVGTPSYMSPEQALGRVEAMDERTDVWGLGALLYEVLTGRPPYVGETAIDVIQQVVSDEWTPVKQLAPDVPNDLVAVVTRALAKDPARRYASAKEFAADLEAWQQGGRVSAREYSSLELVGRLVKRNKRVFGVIAAALVALVTVGTVSWQRIRRQRNDAQAFTLYLVRDVVADLYEVAGADAVVQRLAQAAARFVREDKVEPADDEGRLALASAWWILGSASLAAGRLDESRGFADDCLRLTRERPALVDTDAKWASLVLDCTGLQMGLASYTGDDPRRVALAAEVRAFLAAHEGRWPDDAWWSRALSATYSRLYRVSMDAGDLEASKGDLARALALDERRARDPNRRHGGSDLVVTLRDAELVHWSPDEPDEGLALGERGLAIAREAPRRLQSGPMLRAWVGELAQHIMLLKWSGRAAEVPPLVEEGDRVVEQLLSLAPERTSTTGVVADFFIEVGRAKDAQALLAKELAKGVKADYFSSYVFAALLAGDDATVLARRADAEKLEDAQAMLCVGLALARQGHPRDAADVLRAWSERITKTPLQWPRGCLAPVIASMPAEQVEPVRRFSDAMEAALPSDDRAGQEAALRGLADALAP